MTDGPDLPEWRLPRGVNPSLWQYSHTERLARDEDRFFDGHPLFEADRAFLLERFTEPCRLIDLGCGTGRLSVEFARRGFDVTAVELSTPMLEVVGQKARAESLRIHRVRANLCALVCFPDASFDLAISMFSTLGMIRGRNERRTALAESHRLLKPGGRLAFHAHNVWLNLRDPQGRRWLAGQVMRSAAGNPGFGDRQMTYRGIPNMKVHLFRWGELRADVKGAGFTLEEVVPIDEISARPIGMPWLAHQVRAGGWLIIARK